jgi:hypothetical protein
MTQATLTAAPGRWFPRLAAGYVHDAARQAETLASVAWMLMTELQAYIEDLEGATHAPDVVDVLRIKLAELLVDLDCRLAGAAVPDELHQFPLFVEYGVTNIALSAGADAARWIGMGPRAAAVMPDAVPDTAPDIASDATPDAAPRTDAGTLIDLLNGLLAAFPGALFNPLLPGTQGQVLRTLRNWDKLCRLAGRDASFLAPLMRSL